MRAGQRRGHARVDIQQAIHAGKGQYPLYRQGGDGQPHFALAGLGPPECAGQGGYSGRVAESGLAQVGDQQVRALIEDREQISADLVGIGDVYLRRQRYHGRLADPQHRIVPSGHAEHRPFIAGGRAASLDPGRKAATGWTSPRCEHYSRGRGAAQAFAGLITSPS